jgi:hypothetical protein
MANAELVVARPETIFIGTRARMQRGAAHVWKYELKWAGSEQFYICDNPPSTSFPGDRMFIVPEQVDGVQWFVVYEGREQDGFLEQRQPVFRTRANFWEVGDHEWEISEAQMRRSCDSKWVQPAWRASGWTVCTRHNM